MKICIFSANYLPNTGGVERYTYYMSKELIKSGHEVLVVTSNVFRLPTHETVDGIEIYRLDCYNVLAGRFPVLKANSSLKQIDGDIKSRNFDLFIVNTRFYFHSLHAMKLAKKCGVHCICLEHGTAHLTVNNKIADAIGERFEHFLTALDKKYCSDYYGVSEAACQWSSHFGIKSKGVLYNSVDTEEINGLIEQNEISYREKLNIDKNSTVITFTGRLVKEKGILQLIDAFDKIKCENKALIIAGNGPLYDEIAARKQEHVHVLGKIDFKHIVALLSETDIFCLPSESEGLSTAVLEATASKCYIITTEHGGTKELINGEKYGTVMKGNSVEEITNALNDIISQPEKMKQCVENAYNRLEENFTWKVTANKIIQVIEKEGKQNV